jgi:lipoprotein-releasing system permease protein
VPFWPLFIGLRYSFGRQRSRFGALVSLASMLGMVLGVASLITVLSVMNGFALELRERILALIPHAYIEDIDDSAQQAALLERLKSVDSVLAAAPFMRATALLIGPWEPQAAQFVGVDLGAEPPVTDVGRYLVHGSLSDLEEPFTVVLGIGLARALGVGPGDTLRAVLPEVTVTPLGSFPRQRRLRVVGLFEVGAQQDSVLAYLSLQSMQRLLRQGGVRGLQLRTTELMRAPELGAGLQPLLPPGSRFRPWSETQGSLFRAVRMEKVTVATLLLGVVLVAAFNVVATLVMAVAEKRRDIAVLRSMGAAPAGVMAVFLVQGLGLALSGIAIGAALGVLLSLHIGDIVQWLERLSGQHLFDPQVYFITRLPSQLQSTDLVFVVSAALLLSVLAALYPSWRASRIAPAEVLRYE